MSAQRRRRRHTEGTGGDERATTRERAKIVPWRRRARELLRRLRDWVREEHGPAVEEYFVLRFGDRLRETPVADLERAFDDFAFSGGTPPDGRSLVAVFAEDAPGLEKEERDLVRSWEESRQRGVYLLDRCQRDLMILWDPLRGGRMTLHLLERMARGYAAGLRRGAVIVATTMPYADRTIALGEVETWTDDEALRVFRQEVRESGRTWHDLPKPSPS
jgi:hypothetical protein